MFQLFYQWFAVFVLLLFSEWWTLMKMALTEETK